MARRFTLLLVTIAVLFATIVALPTSLVPEVRAQTPVATTLRVAVLAPRGSIWHTIFTAWGNSLRTQTQGQLTIQVQNASAGDEARLVEQMRAGQLDGACFTAVGLGQVARPALVLQAPGVFDGYPALDRARTSLDADLRGLFEQNGATLIGWADYGRARIFSTRPIARPADMRGARTWVLPGDPIAPVFLEVVGARPVPLPIGGVMGSLNAGQLDAVVASASAASALQWHTRLTHVTSQSNAVLIGGTLISKARFDALPAPLQQMLRDTGATAHQRLQQRVRADDDRYFTQLTSRGMIAVDASAHEAEWRRSAEQVRDRLTGSVLDRALLQRVLAARP